MCTVYADKLLPSVSEVCPVHVSWVHAYYVQTNCGIVTSLTFTLMPIKKVEHVAELLKYDISAKRFSLCQ